MRKLLSEFIGTYFLVFCGAGSVVINEISGGAVTHLGIAITFGLIVTAMVYSFGNISGAHINPAVTISFAIINPEIRKEVPGYILSQCAGATAASGTLYVMFPNLSRYGDTVPFGSIEQSFILEIILTFLLMLVILLVVHQGKEVGALAGIIIGFTVLLEALFAGPISGASMNPARSLGPAIFSGSIGVLWVYIFAPVIGAVLATICWKYLSVETDQE
ncbi:MAG: aquaporin [Bacteroidota bacterium]